MPSVFEAAIQILLQKLPQCIAIGPNNHCSADRAIAGQLSFPDNINVPPGHMEIVLGYCLSVAEDVLRVALCKLSL